ncbi:transcriptional regulator, partial [Klebsiella pneumoniae]
MSDDLFGDVRDDSLLDHLSDETENVRFPSILA